MVSVTVPIYENTFLLGAPLPVLPPSLPSRRRSLPLWAAGLLRLRAEWFAQGLRVTAGHGTSTEVQVS